MTLLLPVASHLGAMERIQAISADARLPSSAPVFGQGDLQGGGGGFCFPPCDIKPVVSGGGGAKQRDSWAGGKPALDVLHGDVLGYALEYLDAADIGRAECVCKEWRRVARTNPAPWVQVLSGAGVGRVLRLLRGLGWGQERDTPSSCPGEGEVVVRDARSAVRSVMSARYENYALGAKLKQEIGGDHFDGGFAEFVTELVKQDAASGVLAGRDEQRWLVIHVPAECKLEAKQELDSLFAAGQRVCAGISPVFADVVVSPDPAGGRGAAEFCKNHFRECRSKQLQPGTHGSLRVSRRRLAVRRSAFTVLLTNWAQIALGCPWLLDKPQTLTILLHTGPSLDSLPWYMKSFRKAPIVTFSRGTMN